MSRSKGFLGNLFSRGEHHTEETPSALSSSQRVELQNILKTQYGIEIVQADLTQTDLMQKGYRKMTSGELALVSMALQYVPQFAAQSANNRAVGTAFKAATDGTFRIRLADGMHLAASRLTPNAYRGVGLSNAKADDIDKKIQMVATYLQEYRYATQIIAMTKLLELRIKNIMDPDQMAMYRQEISECIEQYKADYLAGEQACREYLDHSRVLNRRSVVQNVATAATFAAEVLVSPVARLSGRMALTHNINHSFESQRTKRKEHSSKAADKLFGVIGSTDELDSSVNAIDGFIETLKKPVEIVCIEGEYYTNLPSSEAQ